MTKRKRNLPGARSSSVLIERPSPSAADETLDIGEDTGTPIIGDSGSARTHELELGSDREDDLAPDQRIG